MAGVHHATTRCQGCGATLRVCAQGQASEDEAPLGVYVVCPSCQADVALELPTGVDVGTLQVVGFERRVASFPPVAAQRGSALVIASRLWRVAVAQGR